MYNTSDESVWQEIRKEVSNISSFHLQFSSDGKSINSAQRINRVACHGTIKKTNTFKPTLKKSFG